MAELHESNAFRVIDNEGTVWIVPFGHSATHKGAFEIVRSDSRVVSVKRVNAHPNDYEDDEGRAFGIFIGVKAKDQSK